MNWGRKNYGNVYGGSAGYTLGSDPVKYDLKKILMITAPFLMVGLIFLGTYNYPVIRYGIVVVALIIVLIKRKMIIGVIKNLMKMRKA